MMMGIPSHRTKAVPVVYVANAAKIGGGNRVLTDIIAGLDRSRFSPFLVAPCDGPLLAWARENGICSAIVPGGDWAGRAGMLRRTARLVPLLLRRRAQIVHAIDPLCYRAAGLAARLVGAARVCHMGFPLTPEQIVWSFRSGPDAVVGCYNGQAEEVAGQLAGAGLTRRVIAIPNAVDTRTFAAADERSEQAWQWRNGARHVVLIVGHLSEVKGYPTFLRACASIAAHVDGCSFVALGGEMIARGYRGQLERLAEELGILDRVQFLGWRREVVEILHAADVVVLPSLIEGLPMAVLEAMACGRPVVATAVNGTPEAVVDGETGFLIPPNDAAALAAAVLRLLRDPTLARQMGAAGRRRVERDFSIERSMASVHALYDELLARPPVAAAALAPPRGGNHPEGATHSLPPRSLAR